MKVYHRTFHSRAILDHGFRDATGTYGTGREFTGVWVSDIPLDCNEGAEGDVLLAMDIPGEVFDKYEWIEEGKGYREALIPAAILNSFPKTRRAVGGRRRRRSTLPGSGISETIPLPKCRMIRHGLERA